MSLPQSEIVQGRFGRIAAWQKIAMPAGKADEGMIQSLNIVLGTWDWTEQNLTQEAQVKLVFQRRSERGAMPCVATLEAARTMQAFR